MTDAPLFWRSEDLPRWHAWQRAQWPLTRRAADTARSTVRGVAGALTRRRPTGDDVPRLLLPAGDVHTLVALESFGPTQLAALASPVAALATARPEVAAGVGWVLPLSLIHI